MTASPPELGDVGDVEVWVDQDLCTGDGLCVQLAPEVFEFDIDGLAYVKRADGELLTTPGARVPVPSDLRLDVLTSATDCPGDCIHVARVADGVLVGGLYGLGIGGLFAGESMFHRVTDASKVAVVATVEHLRAIGASLFDVQWVTPHLATLGAVEVSRAEYGELLADAIARPVTW